MTEDDDSSEGKESLQDSTERKLGINLPFVTGFLFIVGIGMLQFGKK